MEYREHNCFLRNNHRSRQSNLPPLLHDNPEETNTLREFMKKEIDGLTVDKVYAYFRDFFADEG